MKARLPQGYGGGGAANLQQLARQAQKMQEQMEAVSAELEEKEYTATAGGDAVKAVVTGKIEVKSVEIKPEVIDPEDAEMLGDPGDRRCQRGAAGRFPREGGAHVRCLPAG